MDTNAQITSNPDHTSPARRAGPGRLSSAA